jgi:hypothetical protein
VGSLSSANARLNHSIAIWYSRKNGAALDAVAQLTLHVNLWRLESRSNGLDVTALDLGFWVTKALCVDKVYLYVPFVVTADAIVDLGRLLMDTEIATAIFSDNVQVHPSAPNTSKFSMEVGTQNLSCWKLDVGADFSLRVIATDGVILEFDQQVFDVASDMDVRYVRFRINLTGAGREAFFTRYDPADRSLLSGYEEIEVVDFRFNEIRNLPRSVIDEMTKAIAGRFSVQQINYFVIRDMTEELNLSHSALQKCRTLEPSVWTRYVTMDGQNSASLRNAIIFYWKKDHTSSKISDFNALARFRKRKTDWRTIFISVVSLLVIGVIAGLLTPLTAASFGWLVSNYGKSGPAANTPAATGPVTLPASPPQTTLPANASVNQAPATPPTSPPSNQSRTTP